MPELLVGVGVAAGSVLLVGVVGAMGCSGGGAAARRRGQGQQLLDAPFPDGRASLLAVRLTEFWTRMQDQFGAAYAESIATDQVLGELGGRSVREALAAGEDPKLVWRAVCAAFDVPARNR